VKDLQDILRHIGRLEAANQPYVLATVVEIDGAAYRGPGTRMLIVGSEATGTISGGCLESDVVQKAQQVLDDGHPQLLHYDSTAEDDILWGTGLGCGGKVTVLLEKFSAESGPHYPHFLARCIQHQQAGVLATVFRSEQCTRRIHHLILHTDEAVEDNVEDDTLRTAILQDAQEALATLHKAPKPIAQGITRHYNLTSGHAAVLLEPILPPVALTVFGAGYDAVPVVRLANELGWKVTVVDHRPALARPERFPDTCEIILAQDQTVPQHLPTAACTLVLIMTHNYLRDQEILKEILAGPSIYLGILGPRKRTQRLLDELRQDNADLAPENIEHLFSPVGLDLGAESAEEIALSIIGEMQAVLAGRPGGQLRTSKSPIHDRPS